MSDPDLERFLVMYQIDPFFLEMQIGNDAANFGIYPPTFDDRDRLRAYLVIRDLKKKTEDKSGWIGGFLLCASIWGLSANAMPFALFAEVFEWLGLSHNASTLLNLGLLVSFWWMFFLLLSKIKRDETPLWKLKDKEIDYLLEEIRARHRRMKDKNQ